MPPKKTVNEQKMAIVEKASELNALIGNVKLSGHQKAVVTNINQGIDYLLMSIGRVTE